MTADDAIEGAPTTAREETIATIVAARARSAADGTLVGAATIGVVAALAIAVFAPRWWRASVALIALDASLTVATFGLWGIADRMRSERVAGGGTPPVPTWAMRALAVVGFVAAISGALIAFLRLMGTWIS